MNNYAGIRNGDVWASSRIYWSVGPMIALKVHDDDWQEIEIFVYPGQAIWWAAGIVRLSLIAMLVGLKRIVWGVVKL